MNICGIPRVSSKMTPGHFSYLRNLDNIQRVCLQFTHMGLVWKTEFQPTWLLASCILILQVPDSSYCWKEKYCKLNNSFFSRTWRNKVTYHTHTHTKKILSFHCRLRFDPWSGTTCPRGTAKTKRKPCLNQRKLRQPCLWQDANESDLGP